MLVHETLIQSAGRVPDKGAIYFKDRKITYAEVLAEVKKLAGDLRQAGVQPGDRVALCLQNSPEFVFAYYAIHYCGGVVLPVNTFLVTPEIEYIVHDARPRLVITNKLFRERFEPILSKPDCPVQETILFGETDAAGKGADLDPHRGDPNGLAVLIYTSGTTGKPKGVMLSHHSLTSNTKAVTEALHTDDRDVYLMLLPVFHITSQQVCMLAPIYAGAAISVVEKIDRSDLAYAMTNHRPTIFIAVPTIYNMLAQLPAPPPDKNPVRLYVSGGAPLPIEIYHRFEQAYQKTIYQGYGLTEASPVVSWNVPGQNKPRSSGRALPGVQIRIADESNRDLPAGEIGEICVKGDLVMMGYYHQPEATRETIVDAWLRTGDVGYLDEEGYLFIVDRKKEMLLYSGMNIYPREIEEVLYEHPDISEVAVVGKKEAAKGELPVAFVTAKSPHPLDLKQIKEFCISRLARYKVPRQFIPLGEMPKTGSGKINKAELRKRAETLAQEKESA